MSTRDVFEYIVDGTSGLAPGDVSGMALIAGVCSVGTPGQIYYLGKSSDLATLLGVGPLVDCLRDIFATAGQDAVVLAVPVTGSAAGYVTDVVHSGTGPDGATSGSPAGNADVVVKMTLGGELGVAKYQVSEDGGTTWAIEATTAANGQIVIGTTGITLTLAAGTHVLDDTYSFDIRIPIGPITHTGTGPDVTAAGTVAAQASVILRITTGGTRNEGQYQLSLDGGDNWGLVKTIPVDGAIVVGTTGVTITVPDSPDMVLGDTYAFELMAPVASMATVVSAIEDPLDLVDPEFVHVAGPSDSTDWAALGVLASTLWGKHRPTFFTCEARLPYSSEDIDDWVSAMIAEREGYADKAVSVCVAYGEVTDSSGLTQLRNAGGLMVGRMLSVPVMRAIGRVRDGGISQLSLPDTYTEAHQTLLESAGYVTARRYAGLQAAYWGDARTMADQTSDYQYLEVLRVVYKAVRLMRIQALKSMYDEAGDLVRGSSASGLAFLKANLETATNSMVKAVPQELAACIVTIPDGQDIVNNGVAVEVELIGIPIIRTIKLYASYVYAGSTFDPRLEEAA